MASLLKEILPKSLRGRMPSGQPNPVDVHVGSRIRLRRNLMGLTQEQLSKSIGITFQQIQKYEYGTNRISASRLWDLAQVLGCTIDFFFEDMNDATASASPRNLSEESLDVAPKDEGPMAKRETLKLVRAYYKITDTKMRRRIYELTMSMGGFETPQAESRSPFIG